MIHSLDNTRVRLDNIAERLRGANLVDYVSRGRVVIDQQVGEVVAWEESDLVVGRECHVLAHISGGLLSHLLLPIY